MPVLVLISRPRKNHEDTSVRSHCNPHAQAFLFLMRLLAHFMTASMGSVSFENWIPTAGYDPQAPHNNADGQKHAISGMISSGPS